MSDHSFTDTTYLIRYVHLAFHKDIINIPLKSIVLLSLDAIIIPEIHVLLAALHVVLDIRRRIQLSRVQGGARISRKRRVRECVGGYPRHAPHEEWGVPGHVYPSPHRSNHVRRLWIELRFGQFLIVFEIFESWAKATLEHRRIYIFAGLD